MIVPPSLASSPQPQQGAPTPPGFLLMAAADLHAERQGEAKKPKRDG